ncbi:unnamed protein product [Phaedon cochleariae]|uniref:CCHC-type domain-containing protein n=1 Tax=Phaedon cochleariae TaxID=80249 RepID=A0A9N9X5A2_PHACE|nr:unnamed protein product [Phaedon cochleariae]
MQRSRSPLTLRYDRSDRRERGRDRSFSISSLSSCSIGNDHNRSNIVGRGSSKSDKYKQRSESDNKRHDRKHKGEYQSGNDKDRFNHSSRDMQKSRDEHENVYLNFEPNTHNNIEESVDPSVCNFRDTSHIISDLSVEQRRNPNDDRLERLEKMVEVLVQSKQQKSNVSVPMELGPAGSTGDLNPKNPFFTTSVWLNKISERCLDQNLDDKSCIKYMEQKMDGIIKAWYKTLDNYDFTWPELKMLITRTFPDTIDFATTLHLLVDRVKSPDESITQYYFSKIYLLEACKITGTNAVSCLIDGLNDGYLQQEAKANKYLTPESLYSNFLSKLANYEIQIEEIKTSSQDEAEFVEGLPLQQFQRKIDPLVKKKCYTCGKFGHISEKCRHAPLCYKCRLKGHIAAKCPQRD